MSVRHFSAGLVLVLLTACAARAPAPQTALPQRQRSAGYESAQFHAVQTSRASLSLAGEQVELILRVPGQPGRQPLVVYLAGLGDPADAAASLLEAWAQAGYAVLAVQSSREGAAVFSGASARNGNFRELAQQAYGAEALQHRLQTLKAVLQALPAQAVSGLPREDLARVDFSRWLLAGFDVGAQTAQALGGEHWAGVAAPALPGLQGLILLSPYATLSGESFTSRYAEMNLPALTVSSPEDVDRFDLVTAPRLRQQVFRNLPAGQKYDLALSWASHAVIGGGTERSVEPVQERSGRGESGNERKGGGRGGPGGGGMGGGPGGGMGNSPGGRGSEGAANMQPAAQTEQSQSLRAVSLAFIDSVLRDDDIARQWLARDANRWLGDSGKLYQR